MVSSRASADALAAGEPETIVACFEELPALVWCFAGPQHLTVAVNRAGRAIVGDRPDIIGRPAREVVPELAGQELIEELDRVYTTGVPVHRDAWRALIDTDGDGELEEVYISFTIVPRIGPDGSVIGTIAHIAEVTELVRQRESMQQRYLAAQDVVLTLQRTLLPEQLPVLPGVRLAARYMVASTEQAAGGDWFDAVPLPDGRVGLVVGDVVGHGAAAAAVMGQLRAVLAEHLLDTEDVGQTLRRVDRAAARIGGAAGTTVCLAVLDPRDGALQYACCGHPPPLVLAGDGTPRYLAAGTGGPLGTVSDATEVRFDRLTPDDLLLCFSDGLMERPGRDTATSLADLARVASAARTKATPELMERPAADRVCELTVERLTRAGSADDVTLLVAHRTGQAPPLLEVELPAVPGQLAPLRRVLNGWLDACGAVEEDCWAVVGAVIEAVSNCIDHAYDGDDGLVQVRGELSADGRAALTISDHGRWRPPDPRPDGRGRGLVMMRAFMDTVQVETSGEGTTVLLDRPLHHPAVLTTQPAAAPPPSDIPFEITLDTTGAVPQVTVAGPVDLAGADELRSALRAASRGGALSLSVDLTRVTLLASVGVHLLYELTEEMLSDSRTLTLRAPDGSLARQVITLNGLDKIVALADA